MSDIGNRRAFAAAAEAAIAAKAAHDRFAAALRVCVAERLRAGGESSNSADRAALLAAAAQEVAARVVPNIDRNVNERVEWHVADAIDAALRIFRERSRLKDS